MTTMPHTATGAAATDSTATDNGAAVPNRFRLAEQTTAEAAASAARGDVVLLPAGAFEQHGPAMPLATDLVRAEAVAERVAIELAPDRADVPHAVIGPALPVGVSPHHLGFAGTVTLRPATFAAVLGEYLDALHRHGWRKVLVVNGHGGNNAVLDTVAQNELLDHPDLEFAWTALTGVAADVVASHRPSEVTGHCGEAETAQMLHVAGHLVRTDLLEAGTTVVDQLDPLARLSRTHKQPKLTLAWERLSPNGVLGDPRRATAQHGEEIVATIVDRISDHVRQWLTL